jgi:hypothetical protein
MALAKNLTELYRLTCITAPRLGASERQHSPSDLSFEESGNAKPSEWNEEQSSLLWSPLVRLYVWPKLDSASHPAQGVDARLEVVTAVSVLWNVTPCSWIEIKRCFGVTLFNWIRTRLWLCAYFQTLSSSLLQNFPWGLADWILQTEGL